MQLTEKRFWIFEAFTVLYAIGLSFLAHEVWSASPLMGEILPAAIGISCISGLITWLTAKAKHWFYFAIIFEAVFLALFYALILIGAVINKATIFNDILLDITISVVFILTVGVVIFIPTLALAYIGYNLFKPNRPSDAEKS